MRGIGKSRGMQEQEWDVCGRRRSIVIVSGWNPPGMPMPSSWSSLPVRVSERLQLREEVHGRGQWGG